MTAAPTLRPARMDDVPAIAALFARSRRVCLPFLKVLHTREEDLAYFTGLLDTARITIAELDDVLLGFIVEADGWIEHLYLDPDARGEGIGRRLVDEVRARWGRLELWCFAQNEAGLAFYRRLGFVPVRRTDGDNEQGLPDVLLRWERAPLRPPGG